MELRTVRPRDDLDPGEELLHQARREFDAAVAVAREAAGRRLHLDTGAELLLPDPHPGSSR
jgi:hypothetical protein